MPTHIVKQTVVVGARTITGEATLTASRAQAIDETAAGETATSMTFTLDVSACKSLYIIADQTCIAEFTHSGGPTEIALEADLPFQWFTNCGHDFPIAADVTALAVTVPGVDDARFQLYALVDPTP